MIRHSTRLLAVCLVAVALASAAPRGLSSGLVISQVYGGGGNSGAPYTHDFVELFNRGAAPIDLAGWSVQYASATGTGTFASNVTALSGTIAPGQYFLVGEGAGAGNGSPLPAPDATGSIAMGAAAGKVILANTAAGIACNGGSTPCSAAQLAAIVDLVGYGSANFFEGEAAAPALSNTTAAIRGDLGCAETDQNGADFSAAAVAPRNSASPLTPCEGPPSLSIDDVAVTEGHDGDVVATFTVRLGSPAPAGGVTFDIATQDDTATVADGDYDAKSLIGQTIAEGEQTYVFAVTVHGDTSIEPNEAFVVNVSGAIGATLGDGRGVGTIQTDDVAPPSFGVVISQVYGGGGNTGAPLQNDYVELFNRGAEPVALAGWSIQQASASGSSWAVTPLAGTIQPGGYYLVRQAAGSSCSGSPCGSPLPPADAAGTFAMSSSAGKVALATTTAAVSGACPAGASIVDLVGYGSTACFEGSGPVVPLSNSTAALRKRGGCFDSNDNAGDFLAGSPSPHNGASPARSCSFLSRQIHEIQGDGLQSPLAGQDVATAGIVTGLKTNGFFMQTADVDADAIPSTSQGIFVFTSAAPAVTPGDAVAVRGTATEFFTLTQLESTIAGDVSVVSSANLLPAPIVMTAELLNGGAAALERFEGMRMHAAALVSVGPTNDFGEIPVVLGGVARPMREPGIEVNLPVPPDPNTGVVDCCIPRWDGNPERFTIDSDGLAGSGILWATSNVSFTAVTGPLDFTFGRYKLLPEILTAATAGMAAAPVPQPAANEFTVAGYNIENFNSSKTTQMAKASLAIRTVMRYPDIVGLVEIGNLASLEALAARINGDAAAAGEDDPAYEARLVPASPTATQNVGFLVKTSRVRIDSVSQERTGDTFINPVNGGAEALHDRPPLVLRATVDAGGPHSGPVIVVVNHLRSFIDIELVGGEGLRVRAKRKAQAEAIAELLQQLQTGDPTTPIVAVGDYNAFQFSDGYTDPIATLKGAPTADERIVVAASPDLVDPDFVNLTDALPPDQQYTFVFDGTPQALDHVLVNAAANGLLQRYAVARNNADFPANALAGLSGNASRPEANSDHDMPVAYFAFPGTPVVALNGAAEMTVEAYTAFTDPGATAHDDRGSLPVSVAGAVDVNAPGDYVITYTATNGFQTTTIARTVHVVDSTPPAIAGLAATPASIGPPNHQWVDVVLTYAATDASGTASCVPSIASNEPAEATGDGNTAADWTIVSPTHVQLRAERSGHGAGRVYTVTLTCSDNAGNRSVAATTVTVEK